MLDTGGLELDVDGARCSVDCALVVGRVLELPSGQMMTMTTATTMPMTVTSANRIHTAAFCHQADDACDCCAFGIAGGDHAWGPARGW